MKYFLLLFVCAFLSQAAFAQDNFASANKEFAAKNFAGAIESYQKSLEENGPSAAAFYNLGNAQFRANDPGHAILSYQRALALEPHHPEAEANLRLVRDKARALELAPSKLERLTSSINVTQLALVAAIAFWLAAFIIVLRRSSGWILCAVALLIIAAASAALLYLRETGSNGTALAIIIAKNTDARLATADNAQTVLTLPVGSEIKIINTRGDWSYADLPNSLRGWIPAQNAEPVRP